MSKELFKVMESVPSREELLCEKYLKAVDRISEGINNGSIEITNGNFIHILKKYVFYGVKYIGLSLNEEKRKFMDKESSITESMLEKKFSFMECINSAMALLTPRDLLHMFPVIKIYDGKKWGEKDYFFTMDVIEKYDQNIPIGREKLQELLWSYMNYDLSRFQIAQFSVVGDILRHNGQKGFIEQFADDNGMTTYLMSSDGKTLTNSITGEETAIKRKTNLIVVK